MRKKKQQVVLLPGQGLPLDRRGHLPDPVKQQGPEGTYTYIV